MCLGHEYWYLLLSISLWRTCAWKGVAKGSTWTRIYQRGPHGRECTRGVHMDEYVPEGSTWTRMYQRGPHGQGCTRGGPQHTHGITRLMIINREWAGARPSYGNGTSSSSSHGSMWRSRVTYSIQNILYIQDRQWVLVVHETWPPSVHIEEVGQRLHGHSLQWYSFTHGIKCITR